MIKTRVRMTSLKEFIETEMHQRDMGVNEFARYVGVGHSTISKALLPEPPMPKLDFLEKLALATHIDLCTIVAMVKPDATRIRPDVQLIADRIARLSASERKFLDDHMRGLRLDRDE